MSEPHTPKHVNAVCMQLLLQEMVATSVRVSHEAAAGDKHSNSGSSSSDTRIDTPLSSIPGDMPGHVAVLDSSHLSSESCTLRIEGYGFDLGQKLTEVLVYRMPGHSRINDILEIMKFICRDAWKCLYGKQMDNLRTNHRGTFVLIDSNHRLTSGLDSAGGMQDTVSKARAYANLPAGIIRGILSSFGVDVYVSTDVSQLPAITFNIQTTINN